MLGQDRVVLGQEVNNKVSAVHDGSSMYGVGGLIGAESTPFGPLLPFCHSRPLCRLIHEFHCVVHANSAADSKDNWVTQIVRVSREAVTRSTRSWSISPGDARYPRSEAMQVHGVLPAGAVIDPSRRASHRASTNSALLAQG